MQKNFHAFDVHVVSSWACFIAFSQDMSSEYFQYMLRFEILLQHFWLYAYIVEKSIDKMLEKLNDKTVNVSHINQLFKEISAIVLGVHQFDGIVSSTMSERDHRIFSSLMETSKLNILTSTMMQKYELLNNKMNWLINERRYRTAQITEYLLVIFTIMQTFSLVLGFKAEYIVSYWWFFVGTLLLLFLWWFFHRRKYSELI